MNPEVGTILGLTAQKIAMGFGEHGAAFAQGTVGLLGIMLSLSAKEYDRGADIRFNENSDLRALFAAIAPAIGDTALRAKLEVAAAGAETSLRISTLNESNYALRRLLDEALIHAEDNGARDIERRIWAVMKELAARRLVSLAP